MRACAIAICALLSVSALGQLSQTVNIDSLVIELNDRAAPARLPFLPYTCRQFSSYDRASTTPADPVGWFGNKDYGNVLREQYVLLRENKTRKEYVLADCKGPGAIVRIWTPNPQGNIRIYLDGNDVPLIEGSMEQLLSGKAGIPAPLAATHSRGWNFFLPIPYAKSCVITTDRNEGLYYQINYRTYEPETKVESLTLDAIKSSGRKIAEAGIMLDNPPKPATNGPPWTGKIVPGARSEQVAPLGPHVITGFVIKLQAQDMEKALRQVIMRMDFDYEKTVWVPIGDFFGVSPSTQPFRTHYLELTADRELISRFTMPYLKTARLFLENKSDQPVTVDSRMAVTAAVIDDLTMRFHAAWHYAPSIHTEAGKGTQDFNFVNIEGNGIYVGDILTVFNPVKAWWGEGDEKISVDGEYFPSHFGTGTEDYYGYGWCDQTPFFTPFNAQIRCDGYNPKGNSNNRGFTTVTRQRSLDAIPFTKSLNFDMEVWHWAKTDVSYAATTFFYALPAAKVNREPQLEDAMKPLPELKIFTIHDAIECENLKPMTSPDVVAENQDMGAWGDSQWSNEAQLWVKGKKIGDYVELTIPAIDAAKKKLKLRAAKSWDYGIISVKVNGNLAADKVDLFSGKHGQVVATDIDLGECTPLDGKFVIRCELVGSNKDSEKPQTYFGLDCIQITP